MTTFAELVRHLEPCPDCPGRWEPAEHGAVMIHDPACPYLRGITMRAAASEDLPQAPNGRRIMRIDGDEP